MPSCMGMFGLASLSFAKRTKEIGVRKVMGASTPTIMKLLISEFSWIVVIALLFAAPLSLYVMNDWLSNFSYHITLGIWPVIWAFVLTLSVSWLAMGWLTIRTASQNPVISLRDE